MVPWTVAGAKMAKIKKIVRWPPIHYVTLAFFRRYQLHMKYAIVKSFATPVHAVWLFLNSISFREIYGLTATEAVDFSIEPLLGSRIRLCQYL